ncbi:hypothetical protein Metfor_1902 [Methanoregula formicica SMSP]|uniref:Uncharacterized protein n=1 Tax=Methanoregula formicica (strain DSM 22288 / NBRC 105244 / SMSP) TaxID=593750 RepID=L0HGK0_METFS|nr:hypothetical protein Metfor_1902 [Methanoregula formicica SMSP]
MEQHGRLDQGVGKYPGTGCLMTMYPPGDGVPDPALLSAAVSIVLSQGGPAEEGADDTVLIRRLCGQVPSASPGLCRDAVSRARKLSRDAYEICDAFRDGAYGSGSGAGDAALRALEEKSPGFSPDDYRQAFAAGLLWTAF